MGANLQIIGFKDSIKTVEQARKDFDKRAEQDRYENGHSYSGSYGMLGSLRFVNTVFNSVEDFEKFLENKEKNDGYLAQVKVIRETKPLLAAREKVREAGNILWAAQREKKAPSVIRTLTARRDRAAEKVKKIEAAQAAKATKTRFVAGGWVSE
jgi:hypothetical protein